MGYFNIPGGIFGESIRELLYITGSVDTTETFAALAKRVSPYAFQWRELPCNGRNGWRASFFAVRARAENRLGRT